MAISTYDELKTAIADWTHRGDLTTKMDDFIALAEAEMLSNSIAPLRVRAEESLETDTMSTSSRFMSLPTRYKSMRRVQVIVDDWRYDIRYRAPEQLHIVDETGIPSFFTITSQIEFDITPDDTYTVEMQCLVDLPALTSSNTTNSILTSNPNIYLFGCMWAAAQYGDDFEKAESYYQKFISAIQGANLKSEAGSYGPAPIMRIEGPTP